MSGEQKCRSKNTTVAEVAATVTDKHNEAWSLSKWYSKIHFPLRREKTHLFKFADYLINVV
jgi:hypothetical protein